MSKHSSPYAVYGFRFFDTSPSPQYGLYAVGYERITSSHYEWDGTKRSDGPLYLFQYTISGSGQLDIDGQIHPLEPGSAFLLEIPSNHRYYYPSSDEPWEFYFMLFRPDGLQEEWSRIINRLGFLTSISPEQSVIKLLVHIFQEAKSGALSDAYRASSAVYRFIMELGRYSANLHLEAVDWPKPVKIATQWMKTHLSSLQNLDEICEQAGLSKYHFIRRFSQATGYSPIQYLTKLRIEQSIVLLRETDANVDEIARSVGFTNGSYFSKVFREWVGCPPGEFRNGKAHLSFSQMIFH